MGVAWHTKWENFGLITSAEGLVRELVAYDKMALVRIIHVHVHVVLVIKMASHQLQVAPHDTCTCTFCML